LEPTLACNIACIGCGKIREYESNKARLTVEECVDAGAQRPAPVVSICGGEPLVYKGIEEVMAGMLELGKNIDLGTNALKLEEFLTGERKLKCAPWGSITRNPYGWKGPCYLLTDGIFPTYDALLEGMQWEDYGPGNDPRCEHCAIHSGFEPSAAYEAAGSIKESARSMAWTLTG